VLHEWQTGPMRPFAGADWPHVDQHRASLVSAASAAATDAARHCTCVAGAQNDSVPAGPAAETLPYTDTEYM